MTSYSALGCTRHHTRRILGIPGRLRGGFQTEAADVDALDEVVHVGGDEGVERHAHEHDDDRVPQLRKKQPARAQHRRARAYEYACGRGNVMALCFNGVCACGGVWGLARLGAGAAAYETLDARYEAQKLEHLRREGRGRVKGKEDSWRRVLACASVRRWGGGRWAAIHSWRERRSGGG